MKLTIPTSLFTVMFCVSTVLGQMFPTADIMPKREIGATRYLQKHAKFDGRGVTVAVFDTGVDAAAPGLQVTSDGKPKIVDVVDASGSGDVRTTTVKKAEEGKLTGLTGRELTIPEKWTNPSGDFHLGMKPAFELFPKAVIPRVKMERTKESKKSIRETLAKLTRQLEAFDAEHPKPKDELAKQRKDLQARIEQLEKLGSNWNDPGPIYDCVVFNDGKMWQAVVDTDEDGDLADEELMTNYKTKRQYATFGKVDLVTFVVNIYEEGNLLSIVADCGTHGTHVAGIIAACHPDKPELNGVAPGAQIVSVKIGDSRLGSNSMGTGEIRGLISVLENKCDLINMSYGGPSPLANAGRTARLYSEIVNRHGVIFVSSAGNNGPALSTVGSPGGTTSAILGIGAYVTPGLMDAAYSLRKTMEEKPYTWSSRGPTLDGDLGVDICAPGGAIAPVSRWSLQPGQLMNGTSMSSPNACGGVALILSGLKQDKIKYTPESVKLAVKNSARALEIGSVFSTGRGLIQVDQAFDWLKDYHEAVEPDVRYEVTLPGERTERGVYLREADSMQSKHEYTVKVDPIYNEDDAYEPRAVYQAEFKIRCDAEWVEVPENLYLYHTGRTFSIEVDPTKLAPGVHFTEIEGYYADRESLGPRFRLPITVIVPQSHVALKSNKTLKLTPGDIARQFITVPRGATWANVKLVAKDTEIEKRFVLHTIQRLEGRAYNTAEKQVYMTLKPGETKFVALPVVEEKTIELTLAQYWSSLGDSTIDIDVSFHGVTPTPGSLTWEGGDPIHRIGMQTTLEKLSVQPKVNFETLRKTLRPQKSSIAPQIPERDELPDGRMIYGLTLTYEFSLDKKYSVMPMTLFATDVHLWDLYSSGLFAIYDENKRPIDFGADDKSVSLDKGKYTMTVFYRHEDRSELEKIEDASIWLDIKISGKPPVQVYSSYVDAHEGGSPIQATDLRRGQLMPAYLKLNPSGLPSMATPGDVLLGKLHLGSADAEMEGDSQRPEGFPMVYVVAPKPSPKSSPSDDSGEKDEPTLEEKIFETKLAYLKSLKGKDDRKKFDQLYQELLKEKPKSLELKQARLELLDGDDRKEHLPEVVKAADEIIAQVPKAKVRSYFGARHTPETEAEKKQHSEMTEQRDAWTDALYRKARAVAYMDLPEDPEHPENADIKKEPQDQQDREKLFEETYKELASWVDPTEKKYSLVHLRRMRRQEKFGEALEFVNKLIGEEPKKLLLYKKRADIYGELGWDFAREYENAWRKLRSRPDFLPN